jgi:hypothetical protein
VISHAWSPFLLKVATFPISSVESLRTVSAGAWGSGQQCRRGCAEVRGKRLICGLPTPALELLKKAAAAIETVKQVVRSEVKRFPPLEK